MWQSGCIRGAVGFLFWRVWFCFFVYRFFIGGLMFLSNYNKPFLSKKDKRRLLGLVHNTDWSDEDSVWECGVQLGKYSVMLRAEVLRRAELGE